MCVEGPSSIFPFGLTELGSVARLSIYAPVGSGVVRWLGDRYVGFYRTLTDFIAISYNVGFFEGTVTILPSLCSTRLYFGIESCFLLGSLDLA